MATRLRSFAKVNLGLRIGPVRADGFHGLATVYQTLALHDVVTVSARRSGATRIGLTTDHPRVPVDGRNTVWQMVERALLAMGVAAEVEIHLEKRLPVQGGMGAGSANAAAALLGLEREMRGWEDAAPELGGVERLRLAAEVGSDVPLFLVGGTVLGLGRGEMVAPLPDVLPGPGERMPAGGVACVVAVPGVGVSTPAAFREWDGRVSDDATLTPAAGSSRLDELSLACSAAFASFAGGGLQPGTSGIAGAIHPQGASATEQKEALGDLAGNTLLALVRTGIENDFEEVVFPYHPSLRSTKRLLMGDDLGQSAIIAALSGSGSALFGLYRSVEDARSAQRRVQSSGTEGIVTETLTRAEYWKRMFADVG